MSLLAELLEARSAEEHQALKKQAASMLLNSHLNLGSGEPDLDISGETKR
jgi:hypothetical protein